jgi:nitroimidazol reductase NimA-like FMN-containing flavoprotein (pyridoxamine 5'-phosphate oxidase superfamily)
MSRRDQIRMSDEQVRSTGPSGHPHPIPMWFALDDDGTIRMTTFRKSQKVKNIQRDPRVSLLVEDGEEYFELRSVIFYGKAEIVDDIEVVKATLRRTSGDEAGDDPKVREAMEAVVAATAAKRVCILIRPERIVSWDHRKLAGQY